MFKCSEDSLTWSSCDSQDNAEGNRDEQESLHDDDVCLLVLKTKKSKLQSNKKLSQSSL